MRPLHFPILSEIQKGVKRQARKCPTMIQLCILDIEVFQNSKIALVINVVGLGGIEPPSIAYQTTVLTIVLQAEVWLGDWDSNPDSRIQNPES